MLSPIRTMFLHFPLRAYSTVFILALISWYTYKKLRACYEAGSLSRKRGIISWILINYVLLLLFFTVLGRRSLDYDRYNFEVWYSYRDVLTTGDTSMAIQIAANIAAFIPAGMLGSLSAKRWKFLQGLLLGVVLSLCIEILQFTLRCGTAEIDDLISNSLGTLTGCFFAAFVRKIQIVYEKKQKGVRRSMKRKDDLFPEIIQKVLRKIRGIKKRILRSNIIVLTKVIPEYIRKKKKTYRDLEIGNGIKLYYWRLSAHSENLGDYLSKVVVNHFRAKYCISDSCKASPETIVTLYAIGSILGFRCQDAVVWGSGLLNPETTYLQRLFFSLLDIRCVRGPKTREALLKIGKTCPEVYGDPAILMPEIYRPQSTEKLYEVSLILHFSDKTAVDAELPIHKIDIVTRDYEGVIDQIVHSSRVISSSLHGVILSEAYGVPAVLLLQEGHDTFKYLDWYYSTGRRDVVIAHNLQEALQVQPMPLPDLTCLQEQVRSVFPVDLWNADDGNGK